ncbi:MAG: DUF2169 domain-containing protein [Polyangiaceae bacterium]|nr:DUF2169 domain-containing protein [Polyangiaceae bacterium]
MDQAGEWPIPIIATQDVACGVKLWSTAGRSRATVVVKATFYLVRGGPMRLVSPAPILLGDQHHEGNMERSVLAPADVAPYLPRAEVLFAGHAYAPTPSPFVPIRLAVVGSRPLVDKTLHVYGERMWMEGEQTTAPVPFTRIPIRYERAFRGAPGFEENPVGMAKAAGLAVHNIIDPSDPETPAGLGPIAAYWPPRRRLLRNLDPSVLQTQRPELPDTFAWSFFHAAPPDQRCSFFEGNEWVVLEGLHPEHPRFESQLPSARARARLYNRESTSFREITLCADTLWIDGDRSLCCLLYRGNFEIESDAMLETVQLFAGLELPGRTIPWPDAPAAQQAMPQQAAPAIAARGSGGDNTLQSSNPVGRPGSGTYTAHSGSSPSIPAVQGPQPRPPSGQYVATGSEAPAANAYAQAAAQPYAAQAPAAGASQSLLAALAQEQPSGPVTSGPGGSSPPGAYVRVDAAWLEEPVAPSTDPAAARPPLPASSWDPSNIAVVEQPGRGSMRPGSMGVPSSGVHTMAQPPSQLRSLLEQTRAEEAARAQAAPRAAMDIEDHPTVAPDTGDLARILQEAESLAQSEDESSKTPEPVGARPSPGALRAQKTTIRGLGHNVQRAQEVEPPPTARVSANVLQSEESPTAQLPVPELLLKLASSSPASTASPAIAEAPAPDAAHAAPPENPLAVELPDEDDSGRPTFSEIEVPPMSSAKAPPQVHKGESRMELERRIREGESLEGLDFSDLDLGGFDLSGKKLVGSRFDRAVLKRARLRGVDLTGASLEGADLAETDLEDALLERANLVSAKLSGATLRRALLTDANLTTCDARRAIFDEASGQRTMFSRARLDGASARGAKLDGADFTEAQLDGATFDDSLLPDLRAYEVSAEEASFLRCTMQNARFDGAVVSRAHFDGSMAEDSMWDRAVLDGASFESAKLTGASFTKASLRGATLSGADLAEARFNRANLNGARFIGVDLAHLTLDGADLTGIVTES